MSNVGSFKNQEFCEFSRLILTFAAVLRFDIITTNILHNGMNLKKSHDLPKTTNYWKLIFMLIKRNE
jgi:hypothetical protein